jgi:hypothetical protein
MDSDRKSMLTRHKTSRDQLQRFAQNSRIADSFQPPNLAHSGSGCLRRQRRDLRKNVHRASRFDAVNYFMHAAMSFAMNQQS